MLSVKIDNGTFMKVLFTSETSLKVFQIWDRIQYSIEITKENFFLIYNGRLVNNSDTLSSGSAIIKPRLLGGKGGFGSMLRAIGAQIEKTTNREACRDLSGRRLRDINEEKRLKLWIEKQSKKEDDASERKKRKLEKLRSEPKHEFKDQKYDKERSILTERVADAVEEGFKAAAASSGLKRASETQPQNVKKKKITLGFGLDLDSDELDSSDDDSNESTPEKRLDNEENVALNESKTEKVLDSEENVSLNELSANSESSIVNVKSSENTSNNTVKYHDSNDVNTSEKSELNDNSERPMEEKIDSSDLNTVEKSILTMSN